MEAGIKVKFQTLDNYDGTRSIKQHIFKAKECKAQYTGEKYAGNTSLCGKIWASDDGEYAQDFSIMDNEPFNEYNCCKTCIRMANLEGVNLQKLML